MAQTAYIDALEFMRAPAPRHETCAGFVARWLRASGFADTPEKAEIHALWRARGVVDGAGAWLATHGFEPASEPAPNRIAVARQSDGRLLIGVVSNNGDFVARGFGRGYVGGGDIVACWRAAE